MGVCDKGIKRNNPGRITRESKIAGNMFPLDIEATHQPAYYFVSESGGEWERNYAHYYGRQQIVNGRTDITC